MAHLDSLVAGDAIRYTEFLRETGGKTRQISNPEGRLKKIQSRIANHLSRIQPEAYLFCPAKGRNYIANARYHSRSRMIRSLDIRKYFASTSEEDVYYFFRNVMLCSKCVAHALARITTYNGRLPLGSPLSPILAHYAHYDVWESVNAVCMANGVKLSIYADDVTVSGHYVPEKLFWEIKKLIFSSGLRYHKERLAIERPAKITGVIISGEKMTATNGQLKRLYEARKGLSADNPFKGKVESLRSHAGLKANLDQIHVA
jgi:retron-type reverse transcriptase